MSDLISRQDAVSEIDEWIQMATGNGTDMAIKDFLSFLKERIESLPSAEPKTGEWVLKEHLWECDQCGCRINRANPLKGNIWNYNFCPNCGARMKGGDTE